MSKPAPRSNFIQMLLIMIVIFLGVQLLFPTRQQAAAPTDGKANYEKAVKAGDSQALMKNGSLYSQQLRAEAENPAAGVSASAIAAKLNEARTIELKVAQAVAADAQKQSNIDLALQAYSQLQRIYGETPTTALGLQAKAEMQKVAASASERAENTPFWPVSVGYRMVDWIVNLFGGKNAPGFSYWFAAVVLAVLARGLVWPLARKSMLGFKRMSLLQPMIKELQAKYQGQELQVRTMKLYQRYGINPMAGCWPALAQMPFFIWVYSAMRHYRFEFENGTFLWINPSSAASAPGVFAPNLAERDVPLIILYGISMIASTALSVTDPSTAKQTRMMGMVMAILFTVMMFLPTFQLPSAFIIYWIGMNILSTVQSVLISRQPLPPLVEIPESQRRGGMFGGLQPTDGPKGIAGNGTPISERKTGAPVLHKPKGGKQRKKKR